MLRVMHLHLRPLLVVAALAVADARAEVYLQRGDVAGARGVFDALLGRYPDRAEARIAFLHAEADNTSEAYRQYLVDHPDGPDGAMAEERLAGLEIGSEIGWCANPEDADREFEVFVARRDTTLSFDDLRTTFRWDRSVGLLWKWREGELAGGRGPGGSVYALSRETVLRDGQRVRGIRPAVHRQPPDQRPREVRQGRAATVPGDGAHLLAARRATKFGGVSHTFRTLQICDITRMPRAPCDARGGFS